MRQPHIRDGSLKKQHAESSCFEEQQCLLSLAASRVNLCLTFVPGPAADRSTASVTAQSAVGGADVLTSVVSSHATPPHLYLHPPPACSVPKRRSLVGIIT